MTTLHTYQSPKWLPDFRARTTIASLAATMPRALRRGAPFGDVHGSSAPTIWRPRR